MTEQEFLNHHHLTKNPFVDEDAQTDAVFKDYCIEATFHPAWSKVYGDASEPATAIVMGPKGSGKTAMRLQVVKHLQHFNRANSSKRIFFIQYDDFNAYLGPLQQSLPNRIRANPEKVLQSVQLWDHIDAIICESTTLLIDKLLLKGSPKTLDDSLEIADGQVDHLDRSQKRDLLLLAAIYDQSRLGTFQSRWFQLRRKLNFSNLMSWRFLSIGIAGSGFAILIMYALLSVEAIGARYSLLLGIAVLVAAWLPYGLRYLRHMWLAYRIGKHVRVGRRDLFTLTKVLMQFPAGELAAQPIPTANRSDDRYAMLDKLQLLLRSFDFHGMIVLVDRVDEPDLVNGRPERMKSLVWPLLDNKLLKHPGLGLKLLLPNDLQYYLDRESREFNERARLDKQNFIGNFDWTGEALYDVVVARMKACSTDGVTRTPSQLLEKSLTEQRLILAMQSLRTPRSLFRFLYRLISEHCKTHRSMAPQFEISSEVFESTLAVFQSELNRAAAAP
ncbi:MAG: hypothetical protein SGI77_16810 [Pirellulaceae bacterium]|nr:hypothetical protein [Pirellulaceae bacterium]